MFVCDKPTHLNLCSPSSQITGKTKFKRADVETVTIVYGIVLFCFVFSFVLFRTPSTHLKLCSPNQTNQREGKISSWQTTLNHPLENHHLKTKNNKQFDKLKLIIILLRD